MQPVKDHIAFEDTIEVIMNKFETSQQPILPVLKMEYLLVFS